MISWLVKIVVAVVLAVVLVEGGSPVLARYRLHGWAHDAAMAAAHDYASHHNTETARKAADTVAKKHTTGVDEFSITGNTVHVRLSEDAFSLFLKHFNEAETWFHVSARATAVAQP